MMPHDYRAHYGSRLLEIYRDLPTLSLDNELPKMIFEYRHIAFAEIIS